MSPSLSQCATHSRIHTSNSSLISTQHEKIKPVTPAAPSPSMHWAEHLHTHTDLARQLPQNRTSCCWASMPRCMDCLAPKNCREANSRASAAADRGAGPDWCSPSRTLVHAVHRDMHWPHTSREGWSSHSRDHQTSSTAAVSSGRSSTDFAADRPRWVSVMAAHCSAALPASPQTASTSCDWAWPWRPGSIVNSFHSFAGNRYPSHTGYCWGVCWCNWNWEYPLLWGSDTKCCRMSSTIVVALPRSPDSMYCNDNPGPARLRSTAPWATWCLEATR